jgi:mannose/fructose-specific phosphotransferase system component IIA
MSKETYRKDLPGILLLSHGEFCSALLKSAELITGEAENVAALPLLKDADISDYGNTAMATFRAMPEGSIVLFDMASGTPFNQMLLKSDGKAFPALCGMNLPMLIEAMSMREMMTGSELIKELQSSAQKSIVTLDYFFDEG